MWKPFWVDQDNNRVADTLDHEIINRSLNDFAEDYVNVIVVLRNQPTADDANAFALSGGYLTTSPWTHAIYGFGGQIPYNGIADFVQSNPNVLLVEKEEFAHATIAYAASQVGARTYVWNTLGLQGDSNSSIAILDTGIDDSHPDFSPGFSDKDFTNKIVGWNDQINLSTTSPYDDGGHGSHVAGLAAGNGFFSTDGSGNAIATWGANLGRLSGTYYISGIMVNETGLITINAKWKNSGNGKLATLHLYYGDKTLNPESWTQVAAVNPSNENQWYTLTYNVSSLSSSGYDLYHVLMSFTAGKPQIFDNFYVVFTTSWPYDGEGGGTPRPQNFAKVAFGAFDKVWVLGKEDVNQDSLCISYSDPQQTDNAMSWERVANLKSGQLEHCLVSNLVGRKWAAIQSPRFFLNTGSLSSSVANINDWNEVNSNIGLTVYAWAWAQRDGESSDGRFVAVGDTVGGNYGIFYSTDNGVNWTQATATGREAAQRLRDVTYDARRDMFIAVGNRTHILTSSDGGENWGYVLPEGPTNNQNLHGVETDNFNVVLTGNDTSFYISTGSLDTFEIIPVPKTSSSDLDSTANSFRSATPSIVRDQVGKSSWDPNIA